MVYYELHTAAQMLGRKVRTIRYWVQIGKLKAIKNLTGYRWLVSQEEIERLQEEMGNADKGGEYSGGIKSSETVGVLGRSGQDSQKPV